jgi:hypothetical protein
MHPREVTTMHDTLHDHAASASHAAPAIYTATLPFDAPRVGAAAVYCADGRYGEQMDQFLHDGLGLPRYDRIALAGGAGCLAGHATYERAALERQLRFLIEAHVLTRIVLIAHFDCGFYKHRVRLRPGRSIAQQQAIDLKQSADEIRLWYPQVQIEAYYANPAEGRVTFEHWPTS